MRDNVWSACGKAKFDVLCIRWIDRIKAKGCKEGGLYRMGAGASKAESRYMQRRRPRARGAQGSKERTKPPFGRRFCKKTKPRQIGVSDRHRVARIPTILKGSEAASFCFRRR